MGNINKLHLETLALHVGQEQPDPASDVVSRPGLKELFRRF